MILNLIYYFSFTKTPEWISTINSQPSDISTFSQTSQREPVLPGASPRLPSPPDIAALLNTHLHNIQQQQFMPRPPASSNQSEHSLSQPNSLMTNHRQFDSSQQCASLPPNLSEIQHIQSVEAVNNPGAPPAILKPTNQNGPYSNSNYSLDSSVQSEATNLKVGFTENRALWDGAVGMAQAVPIKPPHQCDDPYLNNETSLVSGK